jgi:hypothetical protein
VTDAMVVIDGLAVLIDRIDGELRPAGRTVETACAGGRLRARRGPRIEPRDSAVCGS